MLRERHESTGDVAGVIRDVRTRWRRKLLVRGALQVLVASAVLLIAAGFALESLRFTPTAILTFRIGTIAAILGLAAWAFGRPLMRRVSDEQVALYLEEHEPSLNTLLLSAMSAERNGNPQEHSPALVRKLVEEAIVRCQAVDDGRGIEQPLVKRYGLMAAGAFVLAVAVFTLGPAYLRQGLSAMFSWESVEAAAPYRIALTPGSGTVPRGSDQLFKATLSGFSADDAVLLVRKGDATSFERVPMIKGDDGGFEGMVFDLDAKLEFLAEAAGVRSGTFTLDVVDLPYAQRIDLEYHFPAYTGLEPRVVEDAGDIAVLVGTEVRVTITPTMPTPAGQLTLHESANVPLTAGAEGKLTGTFVADKDGFYRVALQGPDGAMITASPQYVIDVLTDMAPTVAIAKPGRDSNATPVEEFFVEARADDDFGVKNLELVYSVNGAAEKVVPLYRGAKRLEEVTAGHTFYMEELGVQAGDAVAYYARAADNDAGGGKQATSDMYFLRIRPFGKDFKPATSMAGGGGGGGGGGGRGRRAVGGAAADHRRHVQHRAREADDVGREAPREHRGADAVAGPPARAGRRPGQPHELAAGRARPELPEDRRGAAAGRRRDEGGRGQAPGAQSRRRAAARAEGAPVPAAGRGGVRDAGADPQRERRGRRRAAGGVDCRGSGRLVRARDGQDGQPVRDQLARPVGPGRAAHRRPGREAQGAGAAPAAGARAPAAARGRPGGVGRRRSAARPGRAGRGSGAAAREAVARTEPPRSGQRRPADAAGGRCDAARRGRQRPECRRPGLGGRRAPAAGPAPAPGRPGRARSERDVQDADASGRGDRA